MLWKTFFCLFSALLSCSGIPDQGKQSKSLGFSIFDLDYSYHLSEMDLHFSQKDKKEFIRSTLKAADNCKIKLGEDKSKMKFKDALDYFYSEIEPLRSGFLSFFSPGKTYTVNSDKFHTTKGYLYSLFDFYAIYDFQKAIIDFANGMNQFVQACNELTAEQKSEFATKTTDFLSKHPSSNPNLKDRFYLDSKGVSYLLDERVQMNISKTPESFKQEVIGKITGRGNPLYGEKLGQYSLHFPSLFFPRVQIPDNYEIFLEGDLEGFKDYSDATLLSWYINQMLEIVNYCKSKGIKFDAAQMKAWKRTFPKNFKPQPLRFSGPEPKGLSPIIKILIVLGILALLSAAIVGFILYKRSKKSKSLSEY